MDILTIIIIILLVGWTLGVFAFSATGIIHALLIVALIVLLFKILKRR